MGKFCTSCGGALHGRAKFYEKCGANAFPVSEEARNISDDRIAPICKHRWRQWAIRWRAWPMNWPTLSSGSVKYKVQAE